MQLYWDKLLTSKRHREKPTVRKTANDNRTAFKKDFDTVCNSTILRRLQDKAQVFPLEDEDYARTRLTHSIEVMSIAESLGMQAIFIINNHDSKYLCSDCSKETDVQQLINDIPTILKTVSLLHDMGNPPFGHLGEKIIGDWFRDNLGILAYNSDKLLVFKNGGDAKDTLEFKLNGKFAEDLKHFDGNAQLFRLVNKLSFVVDEFGMNLTYPVMSTFIKYPTSSIEIDNKNLSCKKMGYFSSEKKIYQTIDNELGLNGRRHPLAFLLEAADDIAYLTADIEDAHHKGIISMREIEEYFESCKDDELVETVIASMKTYKEKAMQMDYYDVENYVVHRTRVLIKGLMIDAVYSAFDEFYETIMKGRFDKELISVSRASEIARILRSIENNDIYYSPQILKNKTRAFSVIKKLLETYVPAVVNWSKTQDYGKDTSNNLLYQSLSKNYRYICETSNKQTENESEIIYNKLLLVTDQIAGMTDTHALSVYKTITAS